MKKNILTLAISLVALTMNAQDINLPKPNLAQKSKPMVETLKTRHSVREYDKKKELTQQQLSDVCWAACGMSRDDKHRTSPTAMNRQEIRLFVFTKKAVYEYDAKANKLIKKADGDHRSLMVSNGGNGGFKQEFVMDAPVSLLMVADFSIFGSTDEKSKMMCYVDAGIVSENINLYCQSVGLATVPRATHDAKGICKLLNLNLDKQYPILNNPIGYEKK